MSTTRIPIDLNEWYFIVATYDPNINEDESFSSEGCADNGGPDCLNSTEFWMGNQFESGEYTHHSDLGNRCKVEIISKTDLLIARGYKV